MFNYYAVSKEKLKEMLKEKEISEAEWNEHAEENGLFGSTSMKAILEAKT